MRKAKLKKILSAPPEFWDLPKKEKKEICNGCGPKGYGATVPDDLIGLNISPA